METPHKNLVMMEYLIFETVNDVSVFVQSSNDQYKQSKGAYLARAGVSHKCMRACKKAS